MTPGSVVIVGAAETDAVGVLPHHSSLRLNVEAAINAMRDAGVTPADIDGIASTGIFAQETAQALGIHPRWLDNTSIGGCSYFLHVRHAVAAIEAGLATTILITHGESGRSRVGAPLPDFGRSSTIGQWEMPYGVGSFATMFGLPVLRFMKETGTTHEQLAEVAVAQRQWAMRNPRAMKREPLSVDDVLSSPLVCYPLHRDQCCLVTDGGGALVVTSAERARDLPGKAAYILGTGESFEHLGISQMADFSSSRAFRECGAAAFAEAGLGPSDIDHLMVYDAFAHVPLFGLEDLGFVGRGEAGAFVAEGNTGRGGKLPLNTNGGGLSYTHTGMYGMFAMQEAVRQVRGEAAAQVPGVRTSFVLGVGGFFFVAASLILAAETL